MWRKEIFFKKLSFIIGIVLIVFFIKGAEFPLPLRSEVKLYRKGGCITDTRQETIIKQESSNIRIIIFNGPSLSTILPKLWDLAGIREYIISLPEFKSFWDSLNSFDFWQLKGAYAGKSVTSGDISGYLSITFESVEGVKVTKSINYSVPQNCPVEFKKIYNLVQNFEELAKNPPELGDILRYGEIDKDNFYWESANAQIAMIKDLKNLDTLLYLLINEKKYPDGILRAIKYINDKKAVPFLYEFLNQLDLIDSPLKIYNLPYFYNYPHHSIVITALDALVSIEGRKSVRILKKYLNSKYDKWFKFEVGLMLIKIKDYSGIPTLVEFSKENKFSGWSDHSLRQIHYDKKVISVFIKTLKMEMNKKILNDIEISGVIHTLSCITSQSFAFNPSDSLVTKKESINKWINWWEANKDTFK